MIVGSRQIAASALSGFAHASKYGIQSYSALRTLIAGSGLHAHHLIEQRFAATLGVKISQMSSIVLTRAEHLVFTKAWRKAIPYGIGTRAATKEQIYAAARQVYKKYPQILKALGL